MIGPFLALIFECKITNHFLLIVNRFDWREWSKIKLEKLLFWGISSKLFLCFSLIWFYFSLFVCLFCVLICLFSLVLCSFYILKHVRLLDLFFWNSTLFFVLLCSWLRFLWLNPHTHNPTYVRKLDYAYAGLFICMHDPA